MITEWSGRFDHVTYPGDFYIQMLCSVQAASNEEQLHDCLIRLLQWKDGKIREDATGTLKVNGRFYSARQTKPNTYAPETHDRKLRNRNFYDWSKSVMTQQRFSPEYLTIIINGFGLWSRQSLVIPAFLLHVLNPRVFPIFDQHVERARRFFTGLPYNSGSTDISSDNYVAYRDFWFQLTGDLEIDILRAEYIQIKRVDDALWSIGKHLKPHANSSKVLAPLSQGLGSELKRLRTEQLGSEERRTCDTSSPEFINRVFSYCQKLTQSESIKRAAEELGVTLPASYLKYAASHIDRWRKQGYPK
jgi:hypothetical protein